MRTGTGAFHVGIRQHLANTANDLTPAMRALLEDLLEDLGWLEKRIRSMSARIGAAAREDETVSRLMTVLGIGALGATALMAAAGDCHQFRKARNLAAWLGIVPAEHSTGGKQNLGSISKRGNRYVRRLIIHGARSCFMHMNSETHAVGRWLPLSKGACTTTRRWSRFYLRSKGAALT